jgi:hypothetical protein
MSESIVFISRFEIREGMLDDFIELYQASVARAKTNKPGTLVELGYLNDDASEYVVIRVFSDPGGMDAQLTGADERTKVAYKYIEPVQVEIYGTPSDFSLEMVKKVSGPKTEVILLPRNLGGFVRLMAGIS